MNPKENVTATVEQTLESTQSDDESVQELVSLVSHLVTQFDQLIPMLESAQEEESAISYIALIPSEDGSESTAVLIPAEAGDLDQEKLFKSIGKAIRKVNWGKVANVVGSAVKGGLGGVAGGIPGIVAGAALGGIGAATRTSAPAVAGGIPGALAGAAGGIPGAVASAAIQGIAQIGRQRARRRAAQPPAPPMMPPAPAPAVAQMRPAVPQRPAPQANVVNRLRQAQQLYTAIRQPQQAPAPPQQAPTRVDQPQPGWEPAQDPSAAAQPGWEPAQDPSAAAQPQPGWEPAQDPNVAAQPQPGWEPAQDPNVAAQPQPGWEPAQDPGAAMQPDPAWLEQAGEGTAASAADVAQLARQLAPYLAEMLRGPRHVSEAASAGVTHAAHCPACVGRESVHVHAAHEHVQVESSAAMPVGTEHHPVPGEAADDSEWEVTPAEDEEGFTVADLVTELQRAQETLLELFPAAELSPAEELPEALVDSLSASTFLEWERN